MRKEERREVKKARKDDSTHLAYDVFGALGRAVAQNAERDY